MDQNIQQTANGGRQQAQEASKKALQSGSRADHGEAARLHLDAATALNSAAMRSRQDGDDKSADEYARDAGASLEMHRMHKARAGTGDSQMATARGAARASEVKDAADAALRSAHDASRKAGQTGSPDDHKEAARRHFAAVGALNSAAAQSTEDGDNEAAADYTRQAEACQGMGKMHELSAGGDGSADASARRADAAGLPQNRIVARAKAIADAAPAVCRSTAQAMDAYLRTPEGNQAYREYREGILAGHPGLPRSTGSRSAR